MNKVVLSMTKANRGWIHALALVIMASALTTGCRTNMLPEYRGVIEHTQVSIVAAGEPRVSVAGSSQRDSAAALLTTLVSIGVSADAYEKVEAAADPEELAAQIERVILADLNSVVGLQALAEGNTPDTRLEIDVLDYGITAATLESEVFFFLTVDARMIYLPENKLIWEFGDTLAYPIKSLHVYSNNDAIKAINSAVNFALIQDLSVAELREILLALSEDAAHGILEQLRQDTAG